MKLFTLYVVALVALVSSCGNLPDITPFNKTFSSLADFHNKMGAPVHTFTFDAQTGGTFTTPKGTVITVPAYAFVNGQGNLLTGPVNFQVRDIYSKSEMVLSGMPTNTMDSMPLVSGGEAWFKATQDSNYIALNDSNPITVQMLREPLADPMSIYVAEENPFAGGLSWVPTSVPVDTTNNNFTTLQLQSDLIPDVNLGNWVNCDHPFGLYTSTSFYAYLPPGFAQIESYLVFDTENTVVKLYNTAYQYAPVGYHATLVVVAVKDGKLYSSIKPLTITIDYSVVVHLQETDADALTQQLEALN